MNENPLVTITVADDANSLYIYSSSWRCALYVIPYAWVTFFSVECVGNANIFIAVTIRMTKSYFSTFSLHIANVLCIIQ